MKEKKKRCRASRVAVCSPPSGSSVSSVQSSRPSFWCPLSFLGCLLSSVRGLCRLCGPWCLVSPKSLSSFVLPLLLCRSDGTRKSLECEATSGLRLTKRRVARPTPENDLIRKRRVALTAPENYLPNGASCNATEPNFRLTRKLRCCIRQFVVDVSLASLHVANSVSGASLALPRRDGDNDYLHNTTP